MLDPHRLDLLRQFKLDRSYVRGEGTWLWDAEGRAVLDLTSQYGALPFGHNPTLVWDALLAARESGVPSLVQPSRPVMAEALARALATRAPVSGEGTPVVTFAQSGSEAIEVALRLARVATGRRRVIAAERGYHGKTEGARGLAHVPLNDTAALRTALSSGDVAAFLLEPIQGEGGVRPAKAGYLREARRLCDEHGALLIFDEVQTGLGRTGRLFACEEAGVRPDLLVLAKALGGGLVPLAACVASARVHTAEFALDHGSTFANNNLTCAVGSRVLEALDPSFLRGVRHLGAHLGERLVALRTRFPDVVRSVRGRGLMWGIELEQPGPERSFLLAHLAGEGAWVGVCASYLLAIHGVRVIPSFGKSPVLRLLPPLSASQAEIDLGLAALEDLLDTLQRGDVSRLLGPLAGTPHRPVRERAHLDRPLLSSLPARPGERACRFAFLMHPTCAEDLVATTPALADLPADALRRLHRWATARPGHAPVCHLPAVRSPAGGLAEGWLISVAMRPELAGVRELSGEVAAAVAHARQLGAEVVGLGAYTSIVTRNGRDLEGDPGALTTGNALTVALAVEGVGVAAAALGRDLSSARVAIIGPGIVGGAAAALVANHVREVVLVANPARGRRGLARAEALASRVRADSGARVVVTGNLRWALGRCDVVIAASSSPGALVPPDALRPGAIVCDVAKPADVGPAVRALRPDVLVFDGGLARLPEPVAFGTNLGHPAGINLACLSETILLALEGVRAGRFGVHPRRLPAEVLRIRDLARRHGVGIAALRQAGRALTPDDYLPARLLHPLTAA